MDPANGLQLASPPQNLASGGSDLSMQEVLDQGNSFTGRTFVDISNPDMFKERQLRMSLNQIISLSELRMNEEAAGRGGRSAEQGGAALEG